MLELLLSLISLLTGLLLISCLVFLLVSNFFGAPFVPVSGKRLNEAVKVAKIKPGARVVDLGSGDGRAVMAFAKIGGLVTGYEINPFLVFWSRIQIRKQRLEGKAKIIWKDFWKEDLSGFDLVFVYGTDWIIDRLSEKLKKELIPGTKIVSVGFPLKGFREEKKGNQVYFYRA